MGKKKAGIILGAILVAAAAAVAIWYFLGNGGRDSKDRVYVEKVSTIMGRSAGAQNRYSGVVQPQETVEINADAERTVSEVLVEVGDAVEEGTPLFNYDTEDLSLELEQAKLELENQDIEINSYKAQIAELEKERTAAAEANKFEYTTQIQTIQTQIKQAEFTKSSKQLEMDKIQKKVNSSQVLSTASGVVKSINNGQSQDEESSAFMTILSTGEYRIKGTANEQNIGMISTGENVIIRSRVDESITWEGTIDSLDTGEGPDKSSDEDMMMDSGDGEGTTSSNYAFFVAMEDADGLMLGQHVLIELDEGQTEEKEGIWIFSGYIVFEGQEGNGFEGGMEDSFESLEDWNDTELPLEFEEDTEMGMPLESDGLDIQAQSFGGIGTEEWLGTEYGSTTEMLEDGGEPSVYVWADDGNGRLEKRPVELGEYDEELDQYEILSGLTEDDLIAWPMEGLYEGVKTVTDMEEVDYNSDLYNQGMSTEDLLFDTENGGLYDGGEFDGEFEDGDISIDSEMYDDDTGMDGEIMDDGTTDDSGEEDENAGGSSDDAGGSDTDSGADKEEIIDKSDKKTLDLDDFLRMEGIR